MKKDNTIPEWPMDAEGQKAKGAVLLYAKNPIDLSITQNLLHAYGIPTLANAPNQGFFSRTIFGSDLVGATLYVPETQLEEAQALMDAQIEASE